MSFNINKHGQKVKTYLVLNINCDVLGDEISMQQITCYNSPYGDGAYTRTGYIVKGVGADCQGWPGLQRMLFSEEGNITPHGLIAFIQLALYDNNCCQLRYINR